MPEISEMSKNIIVEETKEGLNVSIVDQDGRAMFPDGSREPYERTRKILEKLAPTMRRLPNRIPITGHTAAHAARHAARLALWELSVGRAAACARSWRPSASRTTASRRSIGKADTEPMLPGQPLSAGQSPRARSRCCKEAPPLPFGNKF